MELLEEKLGELKERLKEWENFEAFEYKGEWYIRCTLHHTYIFLKVYDLGYGILLSLPETNPERVLKLTKESLKCLQEIKENQRMIRIW